MDSIKVAEHMDRHPVLLEANMSLATAVDNLLKIRNSARQLSTIAANWSAFYPNKIV